MSFQHQQLANGRWRQLSLIEQLANVGSEVFRALNWQQKDNSAYSHQAALRALELLSLTIDDPKNHNHRLKELTRLYEVLVDYFFGKNQYRSSPKLWQNYFYPFNYAAALQRKNSSLRQR